MEPLSAKVVQNLRAEIIDGRLGVGERLKEDALAARFDVSRVPIREALLQLESEGFVVIQKFRGATVSMRSHEDVVELMQIRRSLEALAASQAAERRGGPMADDLRRIIELSRQARDARAIDSLPPLILEFHEIVARASGNTHLVAMLQDILVKIAWGFELKIEDRLESSWSDHFAIAEAILAGSPAAAAYLMDDHVVKDEILYRQTFPTETSAGQPTPPEDDVFDEVDAVNS